MRYKASCTNFNLQLWKSELFSRLKVPVDQNGINPRKHGTLKT